MCGIAGCIERGETRTQLAIRLKRMLAAIAHRGPDDEGVWIDERHGLALGHRRLAIRDLSAAGQQPMFTADGQLGLIYNGEIYNADVLRAQLGDGTQWRGHSDTEVLLRAIERWGLTPTLSRLAGMFAFAVWDRRRQTLTLVRDRMGIKPLYYCVQGDTILWASELKALLAHSSYQAEIDPGALQQFLRFGYVPGPSCILRRTWKLPPGSCLEFNLSGESARAPRSHIYWDAAQVARDARETPLHGDDNQLIETADAQLKAIVAEHLAADVPLGAFLSGGIDSSLVVALMQGRSGCPIQTFSLGFSEPRFNEAPQARAVAGHLGTQHHEHTISSDEVVQRIPTWSEHFCEPFSDTSGLPCLVIAELARRHVLVALTGDGGDELFVGYRRYRQALMLQTYLAHLPRRIRRGLQHLLSWPRSSFYQRLQPLQRLFARHIHEELGESVRKVSSLLSADTRRDLYECLTSISYNANAKGVLRGDRVTAPAAAPAHAVMMDWQSDWDLLANMQLWDSQVYLPGDILPKVDIASMAVGLEVRVPLLDHRLFEFAWRVPARLKFDGQRGKLILRRVLSHYLPEPLFDRPKRGFSAPLDGWLRGPLRDWAESLLEPATLGSNGLLSAPVVRAYWDDLLAGRAGHARIWPVLVFLDWHRKYLGSEATRHEHRLCNTSHDSLCVSRQPEHSADVSKPGGARASSDVGGRTQVLATQ